jgi:hypothetical protein
LIIEIANFKLKGLTMLAEFPPNACPGILLPVNDQFAIVSAIQGGRASPR